MKASEIKIGGEYRALVNGKLTTVRVKKISDTGVYTVVNLSTNRETFFRSPIKFRSHATPVVTVPPSNPTPAPVASSGISTLKQEVEARAHLDGAPHLIVVARAGTGKTTTLVEGLKEVKGIGSKLTPSPQQEAVWESLRHSKGATTIGFCAFNVSIAKELQSRVPQGCDAMTMHSMGMKAVTKTFGRLQIPDSPEWVVRDRLAKVMNKDPRELMKHKFPLVKAVEDLVGLCKMNLVDAEDEDALDRLASHYEVDLNGARSEVFDLVPKVLDLCRDPNQDRRMDFNDMIWLPVVLNLPMTQYDLLLVDEAQDLNKCQQQLALKAGKRLILCGDPAQAIYGFAGADSDSIPNMKAILSATSRGCEELPLTVTRRCGKKIVERAQEIVPDFEAFHTNPEGKVIEMRLEDDSAAKPVEHAEEPGRLTSMPTNQACYRRLAEPGDMVICRLNAPLVSECFKFLKEGRKANIIGRDIAKGLISTINKVGKGLTGIDAWAQIQQGLDDWADTESKKETAKKNPSDSKLLAIQDRKTCLEVFMSSAQDKVLEESKHMISSGIDSERVNAFLTSRVPAELIAREVEAIFADKNQGGIRLSSIHKAKGLEAPRVFFINNAKAPCPHPMAKSAWARGQERNLMYVGITRAIDTLVWVR